jgi:hypothetical protein
MLFPPNTGFGVAELVKLRSDCVAPATVTTAVAEPPVGFGLGVAELAFAVFEINVPLATPEFTFTTNVNVAMAPLAKDGMVQTMLPVPPTAGTGEQLQPPGAASETNVVFVGTVSYNPLGAAAAGPWLVITIVYVMFEPATTVLDAAVFVSVTYAEVAEPTTVETVAELFVRFESRVPDVMFAVSTICVPKVVPAFTVTATVNVPNSRLAKLGFVQLIVPVAKMEAVELQVQPAGAAID